MTGERVLTLWEPWASLVAMGVKRWETRAWAPPESLIGHRLLIHSAARGFGFNSSEAELVRSLPHDVWRALADFVGGDPELSSNYPRRRLLCSVLVVQYRPTRPLPPDLPELQLMLGDWTMPRFAWRFAEPKPVRRREVVGRQRLWRLP